MIRRIKNWLHWRKKAKHMAHNILELQNAYELPNMTTIEIANRWEEICRQAKEINK